MKRVNQGLRVCHSTSRRSFGGLQGLSLTHTTKAPRITEPVKVEATLNVADVLKVRGAKHRRE